MRSLHLVRPVVTLVVAIVLAVACTGDAEDASPTPPASEPGTPTSVPTSPVSTPEVTFEPGSPEASACALPGEQLLRTWRGTRVGPSGNVQIVPAEPNYLGAGFSHAGPWDYVQRIPLLFYGPGHIASTGSTRAPATLADIAPTQAELLGFDFHAPDGQVLEEAVRHAEDPPRLIVTIVWDAAGRNVLETWPRDWPTLRKLSERGTWFDAATIGTSPSNTPPTHATIGTGAYPRRHGVIDMYQRIDGEIVKPLDTGPDVLKLPTLADLYDVEEGNEPIVGIVATLGAHMGMIGHGSAWPGGDEDLAVMREEEDAETAGAESASWQLTTAMQPYFRMPEVVNEVRGIEGDVAALDRADGAIDGRWGEHPFSQLQAGFQTPARVPYQQRILEAIVETEGFGRDEVPDLLFVNMKAADSIGHLYSLNGPEMGETLRALDDSLKSTIAMLNEVVGRGEWALILTADHGHQYDPEISGAFTIDIPALIDYLEGRFGGTSERPIVTQARPTQLWIDERNLKANGATLDDVAVAVLEATQSDTVNEGMQPASPNAKVFSAAIPTDSLMKLPCLDRAG